jgi:molecular chaperone DnaK
MPVLFQERSRADHAATPSVVHVGADGALVGEAVEELLEDVPNLPVARFAKLFMGQAAPIYTDHAGRYWYPEAIAAVILKKLVRDVERNSDESIDGAILCVPARFDDAQRRAMLNAAILAGLSVLELVAEPFAAAAFYGTRALAPGAAILVYDFGGATFECTVLEVGLDGLRALATDGVSDLGGRNFDEAIMCLIADQFRRGHRFDPLEDPIALPQLRREAEKLKMRLTLASRGEVRKDLLLGGRVQSILVTRTQFERATKPLIDRTIGICGRVLKTAGREWNSVDRVILSGGSSLIPAVESALRKSLDKPGDHIHRNQPRNAVVYGAALIAAHRHETAGARSPLLLQRVSAFDLGYYVSDRAGAQCVQTLIARDTPIPTSRTITCYTNRADQTHISLTIVQVKGPGDAPLPLGNFHFPIERPRKNYPLELTVCYDSEGVVTVAAQDAETGREVKREFTGATQAVDPVLAQRVLLESVKLCD